MRRALAVLAWIGGMAAAGFAHGSFHTWVINELYSNVSGTIQFIEFREIAGLDGQDLLAGHALTSTRGAIVNTFVFPSDLPVPATALKNFLVGTQGYAALNVVAPNYIIPDGFLFTNGGSLDYAAVDSLVYGALPTDGVLSIGRTGAAAVNSPTNFAGNTGSISTSPPPANQSGAPAIPTASPAVLFVIAGLIGSVALLLFRRRSRGKR